MSLQVWLPFDGNLKNYGLIDTTVTSHGATINDAGKIGKCYQFNGSNQSIQLGDNIFDNNVTEFTVATWINCSNDTSACIFSDRNTGNSTGITLFILTTGKIFFDTGDRWTLTPSITIPRNEWFHIAFLYKKNVLREVYINGVLAGSTDSAPSPSATSSSYSFIGASQNTVTTVNGNYLTGYLNDFRIYNHCLSPAEVHEIALGLMLHYKLEGALPGNINLLTNTDFSKKDTRTTGWDTTKNGTLLAKNWGGYNPGVANAETCYHAHLKLFNNEYVYEYIKDTETWLGIAQGNLQSKLVAGKIYTFSCEQYSVTNTNYMHGGLYYYKNEATSAGFHLGFIECNTNIQPNTWQKFTYTFIAPTDGDYTKNMAWYCYGHRGQAGTFYLRHLKLEESDTATPWWSNSSELNNDGNIASDSSGYGLTSSIFSTPIFSKNSMCRYSSYLSNSSADISKDLIVGTYGEKMNDFTINFWYKTDTASPFYDGIVQLDKFELGFYDDTTLNYSYYTATDQLVATSSMSTSNPPEHYLDNQWHMITIVYKGTTLKIYKDTKLITSSNKSIISFSNGLAIKPSTLNGLSDFRLYCTPLLDTDIKQLYNINMGIDNHNNILTYEFNELSDTTNLSHSSVLNGSINEWVNCPYDQEIYTEPDGSQWIHIFHHNNPVTYQFSSDSDFENGFYENEHKWFYVSACNFTNKWELMVVTKRKSGDEVKRYRWIQSVNPMIATYEQVLKNNGAYYNSDSNRYSDRGNMGGIYKSLKATTYLCTNDGQSKDNWYGPLGLNTLYNSACPGHEGIGSNHYISDGYIDLYLRMDNINAPSNVMLKKNFGWLANQVIER